MTWLDLKQLGLPNDGSDDLKHGTTPAGCRLDACKQSVLPIVSLIVIIFNFFQFTSINKACLISMLLFAQPAI